MDAGRGGAGQSLKNPQSVSYGELESLGPLAGAICLRSLGVGPDVRGWRSAWSAGPR